MSDRVDMPRMAKRLFTSLVLACLALAGLAAPASAQGRTSPTLLSGERIDWIQGSSEWVHLSWTTEGQLDDVQVRVVDLSTGLSVEYPNGEDFSSLMVDSVLSSNEIDFTALKFTTDPSSNGTKHAGIEISWTDGKDRRSAEGSLQLSNKKYEGDDFAILTEVADITTDPAMPALNWVEFGYKGLAPSTTDMKITASGDLTAYHPQETFTSLHHDQTLHAGESDVARVWYDPELVTAGSHRVTVTITYTDANGKSQSTEHQVKLIAE
jgi:hypothetical protein